jgi:hypothetical protein
MKRRIANSIGLSIASTTLALLLGCASANPKSKVVAYPLKECLVSGNELGSMGDVVTETFAGREIKFCCKPCVKKFHAAPEKYMAKLRNAELQPSK